MDTKDFMLDDWLFELHRFMRDIINKHLTTEQKQRLDVILKKRAR